MLNTPDSSAPPHTSLGHMPEGKWAFDAEVTTCFNDMLLRSIPQLDVMRKAVVNLGCRYVHPGDHILDLGCSLGDALEPFIRKYGAYCTYTGIEMSQPMYEQACARFARFTVSDAYGTTTEPHVTISSLDLRTTYPDTMSALTLGILTVMFIPLEHRLRLLQEVHNHTTPGGAFLMVEKVLGSSAGLQDVFVDQYHAFKQRSGYTREEVDRKALALEGVLVPVTAAWNEDALRQAGFTQVECFWRWMNFAGWIAVKG